MLAGCMACGEMLSARQKASLLMDVKQRASEMDQHHLSGVWERTVLWRLRTAKYPPSKSMQGPMRGDLLVERQRNSLCRDLAMAQEHTAAFCLGAGN